MKRVICSALVALSSVELGTAQAGARKCDAPAAQAGMSHTCDDKAAGTSCWAYCRSSYEGLPAKYECKASEGGAPLAMTAVEKPISCAASVRRLAPSTARRLSACDASISAAGLDGPGIFSDCLGKAEGETCIAHCGTGYSGADAAVMTCKDTGSFDFLQPGAALPVCTPEPCEYQLPDGLGVTSDCNGTGTGETCTAECGGAFEFDAGAGPETFTCNDQGAFEGTSPACVAKPCEVQAELLQYKTSTCAGKTDGESCAISCKAGFQGEPAMYTCNGTNGTFSPVEAAVNCTPAKCESGIPQSADLNTTGIVGLVTGETGEVTCAGGYEGEATTWTCEESGTVVGTSPTCEQLACDASTIEVDDSVKHTCKNKKFGDECNMMCNAGYELAPGATNQVWKCIADGATAVLNGTVPNCTAKPCDTSEFSDFVDHGCEGITVGHNCSYSCPFGTEAMEGTPSVQNFSCVAEGAGTRLHGAKPICVAMTCSAANITTPNTCDGIEVGQSCTAQCVKGFDGSTSYECIVDPSNESASLNGTELFCVGKPCANASLAVGPQHVHNCSNLTTLEVCNVSCAAGYEGESALVVCGTDGLFQTQGEFPACPVITSTDTESTTSMTGTMTSTTMSNTTHTTTTMTDTSGTFTNTSMSSATTTSVTMTNTSVSGTMTSATTTLVTNTSFSETMTSATTSLTTNTTVPETSTTVVTTLTTATTVVTVTSVSTGTVPAGFVETVSAKVQMNVQNAADFVASPEALRGFTTFLGTYIGVPASDVDAAFSLLGARRLRSLQGGNVEADVTVKIPEGSSTDQDAVTTKLNDMGDAQTADLNAAVEAEGATGFNAEMVGATDVEQGMVQEETTQAPMPPASVDSEDEGPTGAVVAIIIVLCIIFCAVVAGGVAFFLYKRRGKEANNNNAPGKDGTNADNSGEIPEDAMDEHGAGVEVRARQFQVNLPQAEDNSRDDAEGIRGR